MKVKEFLRVLKRWGACEGGLDWIRRNYDPIRDAQLVWDECDRADWMVWYLAEVNERASYDGDHERALARLRTQHSAIPLNNCSDVTELACLGTAPEIGCIEAIQLTPNPEDTELLEIQERLLLMADIVRDAVPIMPILEHEK